MCSGSNDERKHRLGIRMSIISERYTDPPNEMSSVCFVPLSSDFLCSLLTHPIDPLPSIEKECAFGSVHQLSKQFNFLPKALSYPTSSDLRSSPLPVPFKRYSIFAVSINLNKLMTFALVVRQSQTLQEGYLNFFCRVLASSRRRYLSILSSIHCIIFR